MQIVFHAGAHFTEEERMFRCLLDNRQMLASHGIAVPGPGRYRKRVRMAFNQMAEPSAPARARDVSIELILNGAQADRVVLSAANFIGMPRVAFEHGVFYPLAPKRVQNMRDLFPGHEIEFCMALRNPATFLPRLFGGANVSTPDAFFDGIDPREVQWSNTINAVREAAPDVPIKVWCNEDAPIIWPQLLREIAGVNVDATFSGAFDLLKDLISPEGFERFRSYIDSRPHLTEGQVQGTIGAFLERFGISQAMEEVVDMPGWSDAFVAELTELYDEDMARLSAIQGVRLIAP